MDEEEYPGENELISRGPSVEDLVALCRHLNATDFKNEAKLYKALESLPDKAVLTSNSAKSPNTLSSVLETKSAWISWPPPAASPLPGCSTGWKKKPTAKKTAPIYYSSAKTTPRKSGSQSANQEPSRLHLLAPSFQNKITKSPVPVAAPRQLPPSHDSLRVTRARDEGFSPRFHRLRVLL